MSIQPLASISSCTSSNPSKVEASKQWGMSEQNVFLYYVSPNVLRLSLSIYRDFSCNLDRKLSVLYDCWLPMLNNKWIVVDLVPSSFVVIAVAVCNKTLYFGFVFFVLVVAVVRPLFSVSFSF